MKNFLRDAAVGVDGKMQANADGSLVKDNEQVNNSHRIILKYILISFILRGY